MRLPQPFIKLPLQFDAFRLQAELRSLPASAWANHPNDLAGNSALRLISVAGAENDDVNGPMCPTVHLRNSPYLCQVLVSFGVVWSRSRLLKLAPGASVPEHADINHHWFNRVRVHVPIATSPEVLFRCDGEAVNMQPGEAWVFDNWRPHSVDNPSPQERIHLVADTSGSAGFWNLVSSSESSGTTAHRVTFDPQKIATPLTESACLAAVMSPAEVDLLLLDLRSELVSRDSSAESMSRLERYHVLLDSFRHEWRQLHALHGELGSGRAAFATVLDALRTRSRELTAEIVMRTNGINAHKVLEGRVLRAALPDVHARSVPGSRRCTREVIPWRPSFIVAAPRSGSTLLFETLATSKNVCTLGGEAPWLIESIQELCPGAGVDSNRLAEMHCSDAIATSIRQQILANLRDSNGRPVTAIGKRTFLEKTPKNALRIRFLAKLFPEARFIFLWRDPRENIASMLEAWRSGRFRTYNGLEGFPGPWSLILPPGWPSMTKRPLEEIVAWQWECTNRIALEDLGSLPSNQWASITYRQLIEEPRQSLEQLCRFLEIVPDEALVSRIDDGPPLSVHTLSRPHPDKWRREEALIARVLPSVTSTWTRLQRLHRSTQPPNR